MSHDTGPWLGGVATVAEWYGLGQATTPRMFGQDTIVGSKCISFYTGSRQEVGRKYEETRVSKPCNTPCIRPLNPNPNPNPKS